MTKKVHKFLRDVARRIREADDLSSQQIDRVMYEIHPSRHAGLSHAAQRGPMYFALEVERIVSDDEADMARLNTKRTGGLA